MKKTILTLALMALCSTASFADITPAPEISCERVGINNELNSSFENCYFYDEVCVFYYLITATGEGDVHLYLNGEEVANPYYYTPEAATGYMQFMPETVMFTATAQSEGCEMSETTKEFVRLGIPRFTIYHDEESDSFWMVLEGDDESSIMYKTRFVDPYDWTHWIDGDWEYYSGPFKVWYAPQPRHQHCVIEVMTTNSSGTSDMRIIMELKEEIEEFGIYGYYFYYDGTYICVRGKVLVQWLRQEMNLEEAPPLGDVIKQLKYHGLLKIVGGENTSTLYVDARPKKRHYFINADRLVEIDRGDNNITDRNVRYYSLTWTNKYSNPKSKNYHPHFGS